MRAISAAYLRPALSGLRSPIEKIRELVSLIDNPAQDCSKARDVAELQLTYVAREACGVESIGGGSFSLCHRLQRNAAPEDQRAIA